MIDNKHFENQFLLKEKQLRRESIKINIYESSTIH